MSAEFWAILGVGAAVLGLGWRVYHRLDTRLDTLRDDMSRRFDAMSGDVSRRFDAVSGDIADLRERMARLEGLFEGYVRGDYKTPAGSQ